MLTKLKLTNFKRHRDLTIEFADGINATRGANEAGKSSMLHAIGYALFGTKALPHSLDDSVTWGEDVKTLKVELTMVLGGITYTFKRGKSGAEVIKGGDVFVTGQNEVTGFAATLLGADGNTSTKLMFASQNGLRGALEEGPKALSQMIEDLAGFDTFDRILDAAQDKLVLGTPSLLEERLKGAQATLEAASQGMPDKPDEAAHDAAVAKLEAELEEVKASIPALTAAAEAAAKKWTEQSGLYLKRSNLEEAVARAIERVAAARSTVAGHKFNASKPYPDVSGLRAQVAEAVDWWNRSKAYSVFKALKDGVAYEGTQAQYDKQVDDLTESVKVNTVELNKYDRMIMLANGRRINHDKCDKCGQDVTHLAHVVETNAAVDAELAELLPKKAKVTEVLRVQNLVLDELADYRRLASAKASDLRNIAAYVTLDESVYPAKATWIGGEPGDIGPDKDSYQRKLDEAEAEVKAIDQAKTRLEMAQGQLDQAKEDAAKAQKELDECEAPTASEVVAMDEAKTEAEQAKMVASGNVILKRQELSALRDEFKSAKAIWTSMHARVEDAEKIITQCKDDLDNLAFNNALVKKLRNIRPAVADKLWNTVLASVSVMFSQMRNEESWVTKGKEGFKVNGQAVESLSGSTLDLLGLSIRCALLKTFLPDCSLLILDEPAHGCDATRTEALVGFIAGAGFQQTLLVTHEEISESMANNIIQL